MAEAQDKRFITIKNMPLVGIRTILFRKLFSMDMDEAGVNDAVSQLRKLVPSDQRVRFEKEEKNIEAALKKGTAPTTPDLSTPELQLLWAAHLVLLAQKSEQPIHETSLWKQLINSPQARFELGQHAAYVVQDLVNTDTVIYWSEPRTLFAYNLGQNLIHIDFLSSLILGLEDTRAIIFHEIGHSRITRGISEKMREADEEIEKLRSKGKLSDEENERLLTLMTKRKFMHRIWDEAENNPVDRYAISRNFTMAQDFGLSMNNVETIFVQWQPHEPSDPPTATDRFLNLTTAIRMSVYKNNGFFDDTKEGWGQVGVNQNLFTALPKVPGQPAPTSEEAFRDLVELCSGENGLENLQPRLVDRMKGPEWLEQVTEDYARRRLEIVDEIWTRYAEPLVQELLPEAIERTRRQMEQNGKGKQEPQGGEGEIAPEGAPPPEPKSGKPKQKPKKEPAEGNASVPENISAPQAEPANPEIASGTQTAEEILGDEKKEERKGKGYGGQSIPERQPLPELERHDPTGGISSVPSTPIIGDWRDYRACAERFGVEIRAARTLITNIQKRQTQLVDKPSRTKSLLPEDGDLGRFDAASHSAFVTKILTGREVSEQDAKRFVEDEKKKIPAPIDIVLLIDGSASMYCGVGNIAPIQIGIQTACIINEASRGTSIRVHIGLWGNDPPLMIVKPGDNPEAIGRAIAGLNESQGWGTSLAPAISYTTKDLSTEKIPPATQVGHTHIIVLSDGDIFDAEEAKGTIEQLIKRCRQVTLDVQVIASGNTDMDKAVKEVQEACPKGRVGLKHCATPALAQQSVFDLLHDRMQSTGYSQAISARLKQKALGSAWRHMQ